MRLAAALLLLVAASCGAFGTSPAPASDGGSTPSQPLSDAANVPPLPSTAEAAAGADEDAAGAGCAPPFAESFRAFNPDAGTGGFQLSGGPKETFKVENEIAIFKIDANKSSRALALAVNRPCRTVVQFRLWSANAAPAGKFVEVFASTIARTAVADENLVLRMLPDGFRLWGAGASEQIKLNVPNVWHDIRIEVETNGPYTLVVDGKSATEGAKGSEVQVPIKNISFGVLSNQQGPMELRLDDVRVY